MRIEDKRRLAFRRWMARNNLSVPDIAERTGIPRTTLYTYVSGKSDNLRATTQDQIAALYHTSVEAIFSPEAKLSSVGVYGKIGAGAEIFPMNDFEHRPMYETERSPVLHEGQEYVAFEIEGYSMPPAEPGWLAMFRRVQLPVDELLNSVCLVDTLDGRRFFRRVRRGYQKSRYNLESWDGSPTIENVEVLAALPFAALTPGRSAR